MSVNSDYLNATIQYLNILTGDEVVKDTFNGKDSYAFHCPFCSHLVQSPQARARRTARLIREGPDTWVFRCSRGFHGDCRGGTRSMHNFLLILNPDLFKEYQFSLAWTDSRNHQELKRFKRVGL